MQMHQTVSKFPLLIDEVVKLMKHNFSRYVKNDIRVVIHKTPH